MKKLLLVTAFILSFAVLAYAAWDGSTNYPSSLDTSTQLYDVEDEGVIEDEHHDALAQAVIAIETLITASPTDHCVPVGSGTSPLTWLSAGTDGQVLVGSTGADPVFATLNCNTNITATTGAGTLQIDVDDAFVKNNADDAIACATPNLALEDTTENKGADAFINNTANDDDDAVLTIGVDDSEGDDTVYIELDGANDRIELKQPTTPMNGRLELTEDTSITEAQLLSARFITNQGDAGEADLTLPAVSYGITCVFICEEEVNIEINPPAGETFDLNGTTLDANDCVDSDSTVGSKISATRMKNAAGTWHWSLDTIRGVWTDTGASD